MVQKKVKKMAIVVIGAILVAILGAVGYYLRGVEGTEKVIDSAIEQVEGIVEDAKAEVVEVPVVEAPVAAE